jgi:hypothetical protein
MALTLTFVHPALEVSVQDLAATSTYVQPVAGVAAVLLAISARTDSRPMNFTMFDDVNAIDMATIAVGKQLADGVLAGEGLELVLTKALQDVAAAADVLAIVAQFFRTFADLATGTDSAQLTTGKALGDAVTGADAAQLTAGKNLTDTAASSDATTLSTGKALAEAVTGTEVTTMATTKATSDTATAADPGFLFMTDYADITYFASDFVGTSQTF